MNKKLSKEYNLNDQVGFILRKAWQRNGEIFAQQMPYDLTPTRFSAMVMLHKFGPLSQNELGRRTAMDIATVKGVVDRLCDLGFVKKTNSPTDRRKYLIKLTPKGRKTITTAMEYGFMITEKTLEPLSKSESQTLLKLLKKIA